MSVETDSARLRPLGRRPRAAPRRQVDLRRVAPRLRVADRADREAQPGGRGGRRRLLLGAGHRPGRRRFRPRLVQPPRRRHRARRLRPARHRAAEPLGPDQRQGGVLAVRHRARDCRGPQRWRRHPGRGQLRRRRPDHRRRDVRGGRPGVRVGVLDRGARRADRGRAAVRPDHALRPARRNREGQHRRRGGVRGGARRLRQRHPAGRRGRLRLLEPEPDRVSATTPWPGWCCCRSCGCSPTRSCSPARGWATSWCGKSRTWAPASSPERPTWARRC